MPTRGLASGVSNNCMRQISTLLTLLIFFSGCTQKHLSDKDSITYVDSLKINLDNHEIRVSLIDLAQEQGIRPYTLIYNNHLIVLNKANSFYSFSTDCFKRDLRFETKLNSKRFKKAFIISDTLYGIDSLNNVFKFDEIRCKWIEQLKELPFFNSAPIYESDLYLCYSICHGEFGGLVFFYNKINSKITFAPAQCAVSIMNNNNSYYIISNLAHMSGSTDIVRIDKPDLLYILPDSLYKPEMLNDLNNYRFIPDDTLISNRQIVTVYDEWDILITSGFKIRGKKYFLTNMTFKDNWRTYLTKFDSDSLYVIRTSDTIFSDLPASHGEITREINNWTLIDYSLFANDPTDWKESENRNLLLTTFILTDSTLIRINWKN